MPRRERTERGRIEVVLPDGVVLRIDAGGGPAPPAALCFYSRDRGGAHPAMHLARYSGIFQADASAGFNDLYHPGRQPSPMIEAACWAHGRRKLFRQAQVA